MYWKDEAVLIQEEKTVNENGYKDTITTRRKVFVNKKSATRSEFYTAKQAGDKIALTLEVRGADYRGETLVEHEGRLYEVVRDYTKSGETYELNCKEAQCQRQPENVNFRRNKMSFFGDRHSSLYSPFQQLHLPA